MFVATLSLISVATCLKQR